MKPYQLRQIRLELKFPQLFRGITRQVVTTLFSLNVTSNIFVFLSFLIICNTGCVLKKNIRSFECGYGPNGESRISESINLEPILTVKLGVDLVPKPNSSGEFPPRSFNYTSSKLKEYNIKVVGGKRRGLTSIIDVEESLEINKRVQVYISVKKKPFLTDTIDFFVDYQGIVRSSYNANTFSGNAPDVYINAILVHDKMFYQNFNYNLYLVKIESGDKTETFYMADSNSSLFVSNRGGNGIDGARGLEGATGANGKSSGIGFKGKDGQDGGAGSDGGNGGNGGNGGRVVLTIDSASMAFVNIVTIDNRGGNGGIGGTGGTGGIGGEGGTGGERIIAPRIFGATKSGGSAGSAGANGSNGANGNIGSSGPELEIIIK